MKYKAIMFDVDGTLVAYDYSALPTDAVAAAIKKAQEKVTVCLVTGRSFGSISEVLKKLEMHSGYAVVNNGAQVVSIKDQKLLYDQPIDRADAEAIIDLLEQAQIPFYLKQNFDSLAYHQGHFKKGQSFTAANMFFTQEKYSAEQIDKALQGLTKFKNISAHRTHHKDPDKYGLLICHANATKLHGVGVILKELQLTKEEVIGVGDSYNDFPLLMASGLKVAMGNAIPDLKAIADYVAPSVTEDGAADVIEKFILNS